MRNLSIVAFVALATLAGCNSPSQNSPATGQTRAPSNGSNPGKQASIPSAVTGSVTLKDPVAVGAGAKLDIKLVDVAQPEIPVAMKTIDVSGQPPFNFSLDIDPSKIDPGRIYTLNAVLTDGERRFMPALTAPVSDRWFARHRADHIDAGTDRRREAQGRIRQAADRASAA